MVNDYAQPVLATIEHSTNSRDALAHIVEVAEEAITAIDQDVGELLTQRNKLVDLHANYVRIYSTLHEEELRTRNEIKEVANLPRGAEHSENIRLKIINIANALGRNDRRITEQRVVDLLKQTSPALPWRNPNAVVATILLRTGKWKKNDSGELVSTEESDVDDLPF